MAYCIALRLDDGLVFLADTRTNAGVDNVSSYPSCTRSSRHPTGSSCSSRPETWRRPNRRSTASTRTWPTPTARAWPPSAISLGGQIAGERPDILLLYPQGNYIRASDDRPFLQIGETKYGKLMLELAVKGRVDIEDASTIALSSMISTARANLSVGPPYDLAIYRNGSLELEQGRIETGSPLLAELEERWTALLLTAVSELPRVRPADLVG